MKIKINQTVIYRALTGISLIMLITGWRFAYSQVETLPYASVSISKVESGDFSTKVTGYGSLQSINKRLLTATSKAVVDEILLKSGAEVDVDTVIMILKNPELESQLRKALAKLQNSKTQKRKLVLQHQRELLNIETSLSELESESEIAMLQVDAERSLANSGIISGIHAKKNELTAKQLTKRVALEKSKQNKMIAMQAEALSIQDDLIAQTQEEFDVATLMVNQLSVTAGMKGVIQRLPLNLGQSVTAGTELALIGSLSPLVAEIKVPQMQSHMVTSGMLAEITTLHGQILGEVVRVDPVVSEGAVQVDIELTTESQVNVKPMQLVDATIFAKVHQGVQFMKKPKGAKENSKVTLFKLTDNLSATRVDVQLGKASGQQIEVLSGLKIGDEVITSSHELAAETQHLTLTN
ncbi:efflux RND transporter periplasmic adaptor subunit [Shewanella japonica]|uniref:efflux RND transporter periplasmic adaptor subunit n=1 Tax=Shewanella japonica TaxID=93973 RepID=UPI002494BF13|nr:HlyD family efflux transporter periplasmic adaptor subunit [Shewanella japonica]